VFRSNIRSFFTAGELCALVFSAVIGLYVFYVSLPADAPALATAGRYVFQRIALLHRR
jgi:hypothetical protein